MTHSPEAEGSRPPADHVVVTVLADAGYAADASLATAEPLVALRKSSIPAAA